MEESRRFISETSYKIYQELNNGGAGLPALFCSLKVELGDLFVADKVDGVKMFKIMQGMDDLMILFCKTKGSSVAYEWQKIYSSLQTLM